MGTQHTPGPWRVVARDSVYVVTAEKELQVVKTSWHGSIRAVYPLKAEAYANARLIAAVPDMVEALKPFATAGSISSELPDSTVVSLSIGPIAVYHVALGSLRAARQALSDAGAL